MPDTNHPEEEAQRTGSQPNQQSDPALHADPVDTFSCPACSATINAEGLPSFSQVTCNACGKETRVPAKLGNFLLLRLLGTGGMGGVYYARDEQLGRDVAIKVMLKSLGDNPQFIETFRHEAQAVAKLNHSNIAQIYSFGQEKGQPYIVMELVDGERVDVLMEQPDGLPPLLTFQVGLEIAQGLSAADEAGLVHGDIKPENILLDKKRNAKLVDFGLASVAHQNAGEGIWGTPYYIAPEKIKRQKLDARSDIYSLGATLYHMLTGNPPFDGETPVEVVKARLDQPPPDPREIKPDLPPIVSEVIMRMLATERTERYPNYRSLISDLRKATHELDKSPAAGGDLRPKGKSIRIKKRGTGQRPVSSQSGPGTTGGQASGGSRKLVIHKDAGTHITGASSTTQRTSPPPELTDEEREARRQKRKRKQRRTTMIILLIIFLPVAGIGTYAWLELKREQNIERKNRYKLGVIKQESGQVLADIETTRSQIASVLQQTEPRYQDILDAAKRMDIPIPTPPPAPEPETPDKETPDEADATAEQESNEAVEQDEEAAAEPDEQAEPEGEPEPEDAEDEPADIEPVEAAEQAPASPEEILVRDAVAANQTMETLLSQTTAALAQAQEATETLQATASLSAARTTFSQITSIRDDAQAALQAARQAAKSIGSLHKRMTDILRRFEAEEQRRLEAERKEQARQAERERLERERREQELKTQTELETIVSDEMQLRTLFEQNDFETAYEQIQAKEDLYTTPKGKDAYEDLVERYRYLAQMKQHLIKGMQKDPLAWGWGFGSTARDILSASPLGIRVSGIDKPFGWNTVQPPQMLKLIDYYIGSEALTRRERIQTAFGAAIYADMFGESARDRARHYANLAIDLGLNRKTFARLLENRWAQQLQDNGAETE